MEQKKRKRTPPPRYDEVFKTGAIQMVTDLCSFCGKGSRSDDYINIRGSVKQCIRKARGPMQQRFPGFSYVFSFYF